MLFKSMKIFTGFEHPKIFCFSDVTSFEMQTKSCTIHSASGVDNFTAAFSNYVRKVIIDGHVYTLAEDAVSSYRREDDKTASEIIHWFEEILENTPCVNDNVM